MIERSGVAETACTHISGQLNTVEQEHNVRVIIAIESGSRAWGFPSENSDYDVRFVYARPVDSYLSVKPFRDTIETPLIDDPELGVPLDLGGWDIRKALQLAIKSNAVLIEWLRSPVRYMENTAASEKLLRFAESCVNLNNLVYHYNRLARNSWDRIEERESNPELKLYCYALRPALALEWVKKSGDIPPMDMHSLCSDSSLDEKLLGEIKKLLVLKSGSNEEDIVPRNDLLDEFITSALEKKVEKHKTDGTDQEILEKADQLFRNLIGKSS